MNFKAFLNEGIIVPPKLDIKTNDISKLNKQFKSYSNPSIIFKADTGPHGAYVPKNDQIIIYLVPDMETSAIEAILQHEVIHSIQDLRSGMKMAVDIQKQQDKIRDLESYVDDLDDDEEIDPVLLTQIMKLKQKLEIEMEHLNPEEEMVYAYMYAKMYKTLGFKVAFGNLQREWLEWTEQKPSKRLMKYFGLYWTVKGEL